MTPRDTIEVAGADATDYLQGQLSQDIASLGDGEVVWSLILDPTGKVDSWVRVRRLAEQRYLLDVESGFVDALVARLERFRLRVDVTIEPTDAVIDAPLDWPGLTGDDERTRILAGLPRLGAELTADTIPAEAGSTLIERSVSFTKGCYTGQELVARVDSRGGNVPRPVRLLRAADASVVLAVGDEIVADGDVVGTVTSAAGDVALAPVARRVEPGRTVQVAGVDAVVSVPGGS